MAEQPAAIDLIGDVVWDTHLAVPHLPQPSREARATSRSRRLGGTAWHVARWLHLLAQARLYSSTPPIIRLWAVLDAEAAGELAFCDTSACPLVPQIGEVFVLTEPDGEKAMVSYVPSELPPRPLPTSSTLFYLSAYTLLAPGAERQIVEPCARLVAQGAQMVFDLAPLIQQMDKELLRRLVGLARIALGNEEEWKWLFEVEDAKEAVLAAWRVNSRLEAAPESPRRRAKMDTRSLDRRTSVHVKRGPLGSVLARADGALIELAAIPSQPVSTAGAGDAYTAATIAALAAGRDDQWGARLAACCGALHTEQHPDSENIAALRRILAEPSA